MLYEPAEFEPLTDEPWDLARVKDEIAAIVADADAAFDPEALWPAHEWDGWGAPLPMKNLYVGAAGVIWALDALRRRGHAETSLDLADAALRTLELERAEPDFMEGETHSHPAALLRGETGPLLVAFRLSPDASLADDLHELVRANVTNPTDDIMWGAPARTAFREDGLANWPGSPRPRLAGADGRIRLQWCTGAPGIVAGAWEYLDEELLLAGAELIWRAGAHGDEKGHGICHGTSGNGFALLKAFARTDDERWLDRARRFAVHALAQAERIAAANGRRRYSLFTGDIGTALFAAACLDLDARYPILDLV